MKLSMKPELLKILILGGGGLGLGLRTALYATGIDHKGLLVTGHWAAVALWCLTGLVALALILMTRSIRGPEQYADAHPVSAFGALGAGALAVAIGLNLFPANAPGGNLGLLAVVLGIGAVASLAYIGFCRLSRRKPFFLCHGIVCIYFAVRMINQYQFWSSDPQLQDYVFYLGAHVTLMLTAYHQAALDADFGSHRSLWIASLAAVYLCCLSLKGPADTLLILTAGVWAFSGLTNLTALKRRQRPSLNLDGEPREEV